MAPGLRPRHGGSEIRLYTCQNINESLFHRAHLISIRLSLICPNLGWTRRYTLRCHLTVKANLLSRKFSRNKVLPIWNKEQ